MLNKYVTSYSFETVRLSFCHGLEPAVTQIEYTVIFHNDAAIMTDICFQLSWVWMAAELQASPSFFILTRGELASFYIARMGTRVF